MVNNALNHGSWIPASPKIAKKYILRLLASGRAMRRYDLISKARALAQEDGFGLAGTHTVKKALHLLAQEGRIKSPRLGWWSTPIPSIEESVAVDVEVEETDELDDDDIDVEDEEPTQSISVLKTIGLGPECVYVYYHDAYFTLARRDGLSVWECKIGFSVGEPDDRLIGQGAMTAFPRPPIIGLVIRTENARLLEHAIHNALTLAGKRIEEGGGSEWFITSPEQIEAWVLAFWDSLKILECKESADTRVNPESTSEATLSCQPIE